jgi:hypothetical protein
MIVGIQGTNSFDDYNIFLRAMGTAMSLMEDGDNEFLLYSAGPSRINSMAMEFSNISERSLKARGIRIKMSKVPGRWIQQNVTDFDYIAYFSKPKEPITDMVKEAEAKDIEVAIYRY